MRSANDELAPDGPPSVPERHRGRDILAMHKRAAEGSAALLDWLARRTTCWVGLLDDTTGDVLVDTKPSPGPDAMSSLVRAFEEMRDRDLPTFVAYDRSGHRTVLLATQRLPGGRNPVLAVHGVHDFPTALVTDAASIVATCWLTDQARRRLTDAETAEARCREAVLHLLMSRHLSTARQVAATLPPELPDPVRVHVIECAADRRVEIRRRCAELPGIRAWIVLCPVYSGHIIVLTAPGSEQESRPPELDFAREAGDDGAVGAGEAVALRDVAVGYEQAFHALVMARGRPERAVRFDAALDPATVVGPAGVAWADELLAPLIEYVPPRPSDADAQELMATARSWLTFSSKATRHLKIHRNTLIPRIQRLEEILRLDLSRTGQQAALDLALRIKAAPGGDGAGPPTDTDHDDVTLADLLRLPGVQDWARAMLRPLREADEERQRLANAFGLEETLRVWLESDSRQGRWNIDAGLSATAASIGVALKTARKRILRLEQVLQRSLLHSPSARYDLWLAVHATDLACGDGARPGT